ncbi:MAG: RluA family pseudouridine synthase [Rubripirellula sp.]
MDTTIQSRNRRLSELNQALPGSMPYDNVRPINVPARCDGQTLLDCVCELHPHVPRSQWEETFRLGRILTLESPASPSERVRGGQQFSHLFPNTIEPDVNADIRVIKETTRWIAIEKPAPLPVHPCGRFNLNSLTSLLRSVYEGDDLKLVHRLDANTTGIMVLARDRAAATSLRGQFEENSVGKTYLAKCLGHPAEDNWIVDTPIAKNRGQGGGRDADPQGHSAMTRFKALDRRADGTTLLQAVPTTGRTNQIRIHLWTMGMPVIGDPTYLVERQRAAQQTLSTDSPPMCLHAHSLTFRDPGNHSEITLRADSPTWA